MSGWSEGGEVGEERVRRFWEITRLLINPGKSTVNVGVSLKRPDVLLNDIINVSRNSPYFLDIFLVEVSVVDNVRVSYKQILILISKQP